MGRVLIRSPSEWEPADGAAPAGWRIAGECRSFEIISPSEASQSLWRHEIPAGAEIGLEAGDRHQMLYVLQGDLALAADRVPAGGAVIVEQGAALKAVGMGDTILYHFLAEETGASGPATAGRIHIRTAAGAPDPEAERHFVLYADAELPGCPLWLHKPQFRDAGYFVRPHSHSEDELIVVVSGGIVLGQNAFREGTVLSIPKQTVYSFSVGEGGVGFLNFRTGHSDITYRSPQGSRTEIEKDIFASMEPSMVSRCSGPTLQPSVFQADYR